MFRSIMAKCGAVVLAAALIVVPSVSASAADNPVTDSSAVSTVDPSLDQTDVYPAEESAPAQGTESPSVATDSSAAAEVVSPPTPVVVVPDPVVSPTPQTEADAPAVASDTLPAPPVSKKSETETSKKVFVCKYVGAPGVDERLQTGQNPISVSVNAIQHNKWDGTVPGYFSDAHDRSYVLAYNTGQAKPSVSDCPTPVVPPVAKPCVNSGSLTWTRDAHLSTATVTLKSGFTSCDVSLNSYETQGATWQTSGVQSFIDHATAHLTSENPTATLTVKVQGCFQQQDLFIGTMRYDGTDGALPLYPTSSTPAGLIDHWNGAVDCTPPPVVKDANPSYEGQSICVPDGDASGGVATLHFTNVVELAEGETAMDAVFTYTDITGAIQTVTVKANEVVDVTLTFPLGSGQHVVTVTTEGVEGEATLTVNTDCAAVVYVHPVNPTTAESTQCDVLGTYVIPGQLEGPPETTTNPETGEVVTTSAYSSDQGGYSVVDTVPVNADRVLTVTFVQIGEAVIAEPGPDDTYEIRVEGNTRYAYWEFTFQRVTVCPTIIATPPAPVVVAPTCSADGSLPTLVDGENYTAAYNRPFDGPGAYKAVYTVTGLNEFATGKSVSYDLTVAGKTGDCPTTTTPPTHPASPAGNGGANTGLDGNEPGMSISSWSAGNTALLGGGAFLVIMALLGAVVVARKRSNGAAGAESL